MVGIAPCIDVECSLTHVVDLIYQTQVESRHLRLPKIHPRTMREKQRMKYFNVFMAFLFPRRHC